MAKSAAPSEAQILLYNTATNTVRTQTGWSEDLKIADSNKLRYKIFFYFFKKQSTVQSNKVPTEIAGNKPGKPDMNRKRLQTAR